MDNFFSGILIEAIVIFILFLAFEYGSFDQNQSWVKDCEKAQVHVYGDSVFNCSKQGKKTQ